MSAHSAAGCTHASASSGATARLDAHFAARLLRPHLDLGPFMAGPLHARAVEECWRAFSDPRAAAFVPQRALPPGFRVQLGAETWGTAYALSDPRELPDALRTPRWQELCAALDDAAAMSAERRCRLGCLLHALGLYRPMLALTAPACEIELGYWRASARYMLGLPARISDYDEADIGAFVDIALHAVDAPQLRFNAGAMVFVHLAKTGADTHEMAHWAARLERALVDATAHADPFTAGLLTSRFYRGLGMLPQRRGQKAEVLRTMDLAQQHALALQPTSSAQEHLYRENLHALWESRSKEARWLGDDERALACARAVIDVDPYDAKAWVELGQLHFARQQWREAARAYAAAALLGPPASAVGRYLCGVCLRQGGDELLSALFFKDALEIDPVGISSREAIHALPERGILKALRDWSRATQPL